MLSQLAWTSDSPLFDAIDAAGSVPPYKDVALPTVAGVGRVIGSPLLHPRVLKLGARIPESPLSALHDRHTSPGMSSARRALFSPGGSARKSPIPIAPKPPPQGGVTVQLLTNTFKMPLPQGGTQSPGRDPHKEPSIGGGSSLKGAIQSDTTSPQKMMATQTTPVKSSPLNLPGVTDLLASASTMLTPSCKRVLSPAGVPPPHSYISSYSLCYHHSISSHTHSISNYTRQETGNDPRVFVFHLAATKENWVSCPLLS